ncbi:MAG: DUF3105 domain-containing protein [Candidatus Promineifilaceae bacterium]
MRAKPARSGRALDEPRSDLLKVGLIAGGVVIFIAALAYLLYLNQREPQSLEGLQQVAGLSRGHDEDVSYTQLDIPPPGGIHSGVWQNCAIYAAPILTKHAIHSMEHGAVWITYRPELPADEVERLQELAEDESFLLLSPFPGLRSPIVLTAWGLQLGLESADDPRVSQFIQRYQRGPQTPEPGAVCTDGTSETVE